MPRDTSGTTRIRGSKLEVLLGILGLTLAAHTYVTLWGRSPPESGSELMIAIIVLGPLLALSVWFISRLRVVVTLSPAGLRDSRLAPETIAWQDISAISSVERRRARAIVLSVNAVAQGRLTLTRRARWVRAAWRGSGVEGLFIGTKWLSIGHRELLDLCNAYVAQYGAAQNSFSTRSVST